VTSAQEFALSAARKYLQSVVFVDDEIYIPVSATEVRVAAEGSAPSMKIFAKPREPKIDTVVEVKDEAGVAAAGKDELELYHPKNLVESFARERMVCALYEPKRDFPTDAESEIFRLCERADVVILDWEFYKEPGKKVMDLIANLVTSAQTTVPHHVRLCAIYTTNQNLKHVASQIFDHLQKQKLDVDADGEYNLDAGSSRIVVLGKPTTGRPKDQVEAAQVAETDLAERIIKEFAKMHEGILPSMALQGLASVRTNTKKILDKFRKEMDGAFLAHRGLILPGDDAFEQIPELLAEEALAVMIDNQIEQDAAKVLADEAIDGMAITTAWPRKTGNTDAGDISAVSLLKDGPEKMRSKVHLDHAALQILYEEMDKGSHSAKERLAALYTTRTQYGPNRKLEFGTIVRRKKAATEYDYSICLMPLCDCVRLKNGVSYEFPFWKLRIDNKSASSKGIVVELPDRTYIELFSLGKPRDQLWMGNFHASVSKMVVAEKLGMDFTFKGGAIELEWIAQLKPSHAQRIAQDIGNSFARVGVLEAEWLRLKADRS
jgi:hypothetical protein